MTYGTPEQPEYSDGNQHMKRWHCRCCFPGSSRFSMYASIFPLRNYFKCRGFFGRNCYTCSYTLRFTKPRFWSDNFAQSNSLFFVKMAFVSLNNYTSVSVIKWVRRRLLQVQNMCVFYISQLHQRYFISFIHISNAGKKIRLITDPHSHRYFLTYYCKSCLPHYFELGSLCYNR